MASTTTDVSIANRGLQLVGYQPISSLTQNDRGARAMNRAYTPVLLNMLRANYWNFSIKRVQLSAAVTLPIFGYGQYFVLPSDFVQIAPPDQGSPYAFGGSPELGYTDVRIENYNGSLAIVSTDQNPIDLRYVSSDITPSVFDPCFCEALSAALAMAVCEELTQSNTKLANLQGLLKAQLDLAKKRGAFESLPTLAPQDPWIAARL